LQALAIDREAAISGQQVRRRVPLYLFGDYRYEGVASPAKRAPENAAAVAIGRHGVARPVRLAVVSGAEGKLSPLEGVLLSDLSGLGGIEFVERTELARVLQEQTLSAGSLLAPDKSIEIGRPLRLPKKR
jgi:hypothetical protein